MRRLVIRGALALVVGMPSVSMADTPPTICPAIDGAELQAFSVPELTRLWQSYESARQAGMRGAPYLVNSIRSHCEVQLLRVERLIRAKGGKPPVSETPF